MLKPRTGRLFMYAAAIALAMSCGGNDKPAGGVADAGDASPDAAPDGPVKGLPPPPPTEIHGIEQGRFVTDTGVVVVAQDDSRLTLQSLTTTETGVEQRSGTGAADGTFVVPIGRGPWLIEVRYGADSAPIYFDNPASLDLSFFSFGRADKRFPTKPTPVTVEVTGLAPWVSGELIEVTSLNAGAHALDAEFALAPATGDVAIAGKVVDWTGQNTFLIDAGKGDVTTVTQLVDKHTRDDFSDFYVAVARTGPAPGLTIPDGGPATLTAALTEVPQSRGFSVHVQRSQFDALRGQVGPGALPAARFDQSLRVEALPGALEHGIFDDAPRLVQFFSPDGTADFDQSFSYGNPFATGGVPWDEFVRTSYKFDVRVLAAGATTAVNLQVGFEANYPIAALTPSGTIAVALSPVRNVKIAGLDLGVPRSGVGLTPKITWDAPATGTPTDYRVVVERVMQSGTTTTLQNVADFRTKQTQIQLPSQVLLRGGSYVLLLEANDIGGIDLTVPFIVDIKRPHFHALSTTAQFTP
jgi:hypothetical protein